ncbi:Death domain-containing protein 1 [Taenia solium]|eukprot:TsM_000018300 transcript=TsM_000018300 gene=TsM_000018300
MNELEGHTEFEEEEGTEYNGEEVGEEEEEEGEEEEDEVIQNEESQFLDPTYLNNQVFYRDLPPNMTPAMLRRIVSVELERLKGMQPSEFVEKMEELKHLHNQIYEAADKFIKQVVSQIPFITPIFKHVSEYDQQACDKVLAATDEDWDSAGITPEDREALLTSLKDRMVESVQINFDFTHQISYIASPLTVWRLNACTAVWAGNNELVNAHKVTPFLFDEAEADRRRGGEDEEGELARKGGASSTADAAAAEEEAQATQREADAAERARLEAEMYVEGQLDPEEIASAERPPLKEWIKYVYTTGEGAEQRVICYVRAPPDCLVSQDRLICSYANALAQWPDLPGNAEVIGNFVCIRPRHPKLICILEHPEPPHSLWVDLQTADMAYEDSRYLEFKLSRLVAPIALAPAARIRRDIGEFGRGGGKLTSLVDKRVMLTLPSGALKIACTYSIQVQPISQHHAHLLRDQNLSFMSQFTACSPLVILTGPKKILFKAALFTLPLTDTNPSNQVVIMSNASMPDAFLGHKKPKGHRDGNSESEAQAGENVGDEEEAGSEQLSEGGNSPRELDPFQRSLLLPKLLAGANSSHSEVNLVYSGVEDSNWKIWDNVDFVETKNVDICAFSFNRIVPRKFMAIQTRTVVDNDNLIQMAQVLERSLSQRIVFACLRQNKQQPSRVCFAICLTQDLEKTLSQMAAKGFTEGGKPIGPLFVYERQQFDVALKGNIRPKRESTGRSSIQLDTERGKMKITFNTSLRNEYTVEVEEFDSSAQVACEKYRGFIEISYKQLTKVSAKRGKGRSNPMGPKKFATELQTAILCQLLVTLPKKAIEADVNKDILSYRFDSKDVVTNEMLQELARKLPGETWRRLGMALDLSRTQLQAIGGRADSSRKNRALTMLRSWIKNLELRVDRGEKLRAALTAIGRSDLAGDFISQGKAEFTTTPSSVGTPILTTPPTMNSK